MAVDTNPLADGARTPEDAFFRASEARRLRRAHETEALEDLARALAVTPEALPSALIEAGLTAETAPAFELLPLVEIAWANGSVEREERWRILSHGIGLGLVLGEPAHARIERWLRERPAPELFEAWHAVAGARPPAPRGAPDPERLRSAAEAVARAAGGVFGLRAISSAEAAVLRRLGVDPNRPGLGGSSA
jgi:hypothetical protein